MLPVLFAYALYFIVGQRHRRIGHQDDMHARAFLDVEHSLALLVEKEGGDFDREPRDDTAGHVLHRLFFDDAQNRQRQGLRAPDVAAAVARRAHPQARFPERRAQPLARHFQEPESRDAPGLDPRPILLQRLPQPVLDLALIPGRGHVDEVDDDQPADVAQPELAGNFVRGFEVRAECGLLDVSPLGRARGVHVDAHQRLGVIDHDAAAGGKVDGMGERGLDLALDLETVEEGDPGFVELDLAGALRHHLGDEVPRLPVHLFVVDEDLAHVLAEIVTDRADDDVAFLVDEKRPRPFVHRRLDRAPQLEEVIQVPLQVLLCPPDSGRAHDEPHARRNVEGAQRLAQLRALLSFDPARDPARPRVVGHEHQIASGKARKGGERGALPATLLLLHLDEKLQPFLQDVLDGRGLAGCGGLSGVVLVRHLLERQEAVPLRSVVDERGFEAGLDTSDLRLVDARLAQAARGDLDVEVVEELSIHHRNPALLGLGCVDQHSFHGLDPVAGRGPATASDSGIEGEGGEIERRRRHGSRAGYRALTGRSGRPGSNEVVHAAPERCLPMRPARPTDAPPGRIRHLPHAPGALP